MAINNTQLKTHLDKVEAGLQDAVADLKKELGEIVHKRHDQRQEAEDHHSDRIVDELKKAKADLIEAYSQLESGIDDKIRTLKDSPMTLVITTLAILGAYGLGIWTGHLFGF